MSDPTVEFDARVRQDVSDRLRQAERLLTHVHDDLRVLHQTHEEEESAKEVLSTVLHGLVVVRSKAAEAKTAMETT